MPGEAAPSRDAVSSEVVARPGGLSCSSCIVIAPSVSVDASRAFSHWTRGGTRWRSFPERAFGASEIQACTLHELFFNLTPAQVNA